MRVLSRTIRVRRDTWATMERVKAAYAAKIGKKKVSHSTFLEECCHLAELLVSNNEVYYAAGQLHYDVTEARGAAVLESIKNKEPVTPPIILLFLGNDDGKIK